MPYIGFNTENDPARAAIRELLNEHDPVRVVGGSWRARPVTFDFRTIDGVDGNEMAWTATQRSAAGNPSDEDIKDRGITVIVRAAPYGGDSYDRWCTVLSEGTADYENGFGWFALPDGSPYPNDYGLLITRNELYDQFQTDHGYRPTLYGDPGNYAVGSVGPGVIQLFMEPQLALPGIHDQQTTVKLWLSLFRVALSRYHNDTSDWDAAQAERARRAFVENLTMNPTLEIAQLRSALATHETSMQEQQSRVDRALQRLEQAQAQAAGVAGQIDAIVQQAAVMTNEEDLAAAYDRLLESDDIDNITVNNAGNITILTNEINITRIDTGQSVPLGKMRVTLTNNGSVVHVTNLSNVRGGRHHPHITGNQQICWGNLQATWSALCKSNDIQAKVALIMRYLKSCNPVDDWGRYAAMWFGDPESRGDLILGFEAHDHEEEGVGV